MKKKICLLLVTIISLFIFSGEVGAIYMYVECDYSDKCGGGLRDVSLGMKKYAMLTNKVGEENTFAISHYVYVPFLETIDLGSVLTGQAIVGVTTQATTSHIGDLYFAYVLEDDYDNGTGLNGCWRKGIGGYGWDFTCNSNTAYGDRSSKNILTDGICPACLFSEPYGKTGDFLYNADSNDRVGVYQVVPAGEGNVLEREGIYKTEYVVYSFIDSNGVPRVFMEGYTSDGAYAFVGPAFLGYYGDNIINYQLDQIKRLKGDFWKVHEIDESRIIFSDHYVVGNNIFNSVNVCKGKTAEECANSKYKYKVLLSTAHPELMEEIVSSWYEENKSEIVLESGIFAVLENDQFNSTCNDLVSNFIDGKSYKLSKEYDAEKLITDLEVAYNVLFDFYNNGEFTYKDYSEVGGKLSINESVVTKVYSDVFMSDSLLGIAYKDSKSYHLNESDLTVALIADISDILTKFIYGEKTVPEINIVNIRDHVDEYVALYYTTVAYLDANKFLFGLTPEQSKRVEILKDNFANLVKIHELDIYPIVDCKGLLGEDLINKINGYLDIFKIAVPIILIAFGIIDFTKAVFAGEDNMKKAQKDFFKRIGISVLVFLTPTFVNLILGIANRVWPIIQPSSCGIFE